MSHQLGGTAPVTLDLDADVAGPGADLAGGANGRGRWLVTAAVALLALVGGGLLGRDGATAPRPEQVRFLSGLRADLVPARTDPSDLGQMKLAVILSNSSRQPVRLDRLQVQGLGMTMLGLPVNRMIPPGDRLVLPATVLPDCGTRSRPALQVLAATPGTGLRPVRIEPVEVEPGAADGPAQSAARVLRSVCPRTSTEVAVSVVDGLADPDDASRMHVRIVNHGRWPAVVDAQPAGGALRVAAAALPVELEPGESAVLRLRVSLRRCADRRLLGQVPAFTGLDAVSSAGWRQVTLRVVVREPVPGLDPQLWRDAIGAATPARCAAA